MKDNLRVIARLDIKNNFVIKGIHLEGLRKVGDPNELAKIYYEQGIDEIIFMDAVASLYDRNNLFHIIEKACSNVFIPISVGGGLRSIDDVKKALDSGADKVVINTGCIKNINLVSEIANKYGSQCLVGSIEAKRTKDEWLCYFDNGREPTNKKVTEWAKILENEGIGELIITSIDQEGTQKGFDVELIRKIESATKCPIIVSGGFGNQAHLENLLSSSWPSGIALASVLHYKKKNVSEIKSIINKIRQK